MIGELMTIERTEYFDLCGNRRALQGQSRGAGRLPGAAVPGNPVRD
jgi:hypothetical protein